MFLIYNFSPILKLEIIENYNCFFQAMQAKDGQLDIKFERLPQQLMFEQSQ